MDISRFSHGTSTGYGKHKCRCAECVAAQKAASRRNYERHREEDNARSRARYQANREQELARRADNYRQNLDREREYHRRYQQENAERVNAKNKLWRAENPEKARQWDRINRERKKHARWNADARTWFDSLVDPACTYCGVPAELADHVIPISKGGPGTVENMAPSCRSCNSAKSKLGMAEFLRRLRERTPDA